MSYLVIVQFASVCLFSYCRVSFLGLKWSVKSHMKWDLLFPFILGFLLLCFNYFALMKHGVLLFYIGYVYLST